MDSETIYGVLIAIGVAAIIIANKYFKKSE